MTVGTPIDRTWVVVMRDGTIVVDWGEGVYQDVHTGEFYKSTDAEVSHRVTNDELEWLKHIDRVSQYDSRTVHFYNLPERPQSTIE
jgi:hypothetical protein